MCGVINGDHLRGGCSVATTVSRRIGDRGVSLGENVAYRHSAASDGDGTIVVGRCITKLGITDNGAARSSTGSSTHSHIGWRGDRGRRGVLDYDCALNGRLVSTAIRRRVRDRVGAEYVHIRQACRHYVDVLGHAIIGRRHTRIIEAGRMTFERH